jgi:hypothetical protein
VLKTEESAPALAAIEPATLLSLALDAAREAGALLREKLGQILETHLGGAAEVLGMKVSTPVFESATNGRQSRICPPYARGLPNVVPAHAYAAAAGGGFIPRVGEGPPPGQ